MDAALKLGCKATTGPEVGGGDRVGRLHRRGIFGESYESCRHVSNVIPVDD